ncbi:hypothetical protein L6R52_16210 [Myxococcota bacterium]|nr:hypothetical protein [Myxococcota bacterium]
MNLHWTIEEHANFGRTVLLSGCITEEADFLPLTSLSGDDPLRLDLSGVEQINSCGVREWIHFVTCLTRGARPFELLRCSPAIVRQLNMISNFRGGGLIRSVMLPYYCADCSKEQHRLLELNGGAPPPIEDVVTCVSCGGPAEFDDLPNTYMAFLH